MSFINSDYFNPFIFYDQFCRPYIFQTMNSDGSKNQSLKYQRFMPSGIKDIGIRKMIFVAKIQFL